MGDIKDMSEPTWKRQGFRSNGEYLNILAEKRGFRSHGEYQAHLIRNKGFKSQGEYQAHLVKKRGFKSLSEYYEFLAKEKGFESYSAYEQDLVKKRGFESIYEYQKHLAKESGFETCHEYHEYLAKQKGFKSRYEYEEYTAKQKEFKSERQTSPKKDVNPYLTNDSKFVFSKKVIKLDLFKHGCVKELLNYINSKDVELVKVEVLIKKANRELKIGNNNIKLFLRNASSLDAEEKKWICVTTK